MSDESDYEFLRDAVMDAFQPCHCEPEQETEHDYTCGRCRALGRLEDKSVQR
jgi:hypothetical protein